MSETTLRAEPGRTTGSRASRRLRRDGMVPAVLYGKDSEPISVAVEERELRQALSTDAGLNAILNVEVNGAAHTALAREVQRHPVRGDIIHLDFVKILLTDRVEAQVHIEFVGEPVGVREEGGIVETVTNSVLLSAIATAIPDSIELNIDGLGIGDTLKVADLPELEGVDYLDDEDLTLVTVTVPAAVLAEEEVEEGEELEEGEEGVEAEGEEATAEAADEAGSAGDE